MSEPRTALTAALAATLLGATLALATTPAVAVSGAALTAAGLAAVALLVRKRGVAALREELTFTLMAAAAGAATLAIAWNGIQVDPLLGLGGASVSSFTPSDLLVVLAAAAGAALVATRGRLPAAPPPWVLALGVALAAAALLAELAGNPGSVETASLSRSARELVRSDTINPLKGLLKFEVALLLIPVVIAAVAGATGRAVALANLWLLSAAVSALLALTDTIGLTTVSKLTGAATLNLRATGLAGHPNHLGLTCALAVPVAVFGLVNGSRRTKALYGVAVFLLGFAVMISGSRTALLVGAVGAALTALVVARGTARLALLAVVALAMASGGIAGAALTGVSAGAYEETDALARFDPSSQSGRISIEARAELRERAIDQIEARPLTGVGFQEINTSHTIYLQLLASGGLLAFSAFMLFVVGALAVSWRLVRRRSLPGPERRLVLALGVSFCGWLAGGLASNVLIDGYVYVPVALLLALACHSRPDHASDRDGQRADERTLSAGRPAPA